MSYSNSPPELHQEVFPYSYPHGYHYLSDGSTIGGDESNFWSNSPRSESPSPNILHSQNQIDSSYLYSNGGCPTPNHYSPYRTSKLETFWYQNHTPAESGVRFVTAVSGETGLGPPFVRVVKRRTTANRKERRRTQSINNAYHDLRSCIPNVPVDTKLSKIKTLRLATSYISYLTRALETDDTPGTFKAELGTLSRKSSSHNNSSNNSQQSHNNNHCSSHGSPKSDSSEDTASSKKTKGRTGWPQHVWALELKQEQAL